MTPPSSAVCVCVCVAGAAAEAGDGDLLGGPAAVAAGADPGAGPAGARGGAAERGRGGRGGAVGDERQPARRAGGARAALRALREHAKLPPLRPLGHPHAHTHTTHRSPPPFPPQHTHELSVIPLSHKHSRFRGHPARAQNPHGTLARTHSCPSRSRTREALSPPALPGPATSLSLSTYTTASFATHPSLALRLAGALVVVVVVVVVVGVCGGGPEEKPAKDGVGTGRLRTPAGESVAGSLCVAGETAPVHRAARARGPGPGPRAQLWAVWQQPARSGGGAGDGARGGEAHSREALAADG